MGLIGKRNIENVNSANSTNLLFVFFPFGECEYYCKENFPSHLVRNIVKYVYFVLTKSQMLEVIKAVSTNDFNGVIYLVNSNWSYSDTVNFIKSNDITGIDSSSFLKRITTTDFVKTFK